MFKKKKNTNSCCDVWRKFEKIREHHDLTGLVENTKMAYRFYEGDQWHGIEDGKDTLPIYNFIQPVVNYKVSMVAMNSMIINYSTIGERDDKTDRVTSMLNKYAAQLWERLKMDSKCWSAISAANIAGDSYVYFYDADVNSQLIDNTNIFFGDEQQPDIQKQPYIIIAERKPVDDVIKIAKENKIPKEKLSDIVSDEAAEDKVTTENTDKEINVGNGMCTSLLYLELKENGNLEYCRCTKHVEYQPKEVIAGYGCYPIASLRIKPKKGSARGRGEVLPLINNQIEVNKNLARRVLNTQLTAYSKLVYAGDKVQNINAITDVGTAIEIDGATIEDVGKYIKYISPAQMSPEAANLTNELMSTTRDLAGAGDAALGNIDPTQASGTAIIAVRDQASIPLNEQTAAFKQFVEDIAKIWLNTIRVYNPDGISVDKDTMITQQDIKDIDLIVQIDVSSKTPFSKFAREQALERLFIQGHISFEEFVDSLDDDSSIPKAKLEKIIKARITAAQAQTNKEKDDYLALLPGTMNDLESEIVEAQSTYSADNEQKLKELATHASLQYGGEM